LPLEFLGRLEDNAGIGDLLFQREGRASMSALDVPQTIRREPVDGIPPLRNGDHLTRDEFERRYEAMPHVNKAELIEGVVHMPSPYRPKNTVNRIFRAYGSIPPPCCAATWRACSNCSNAASPARNTPPLSIVRPPRTHPTDKPRARRNASNPSAPSRHRTSPAHQRRATKTPPFRRSPSKIS